MRLTVSLPGFPSLNTPADKQCYPDLTSRGTCSFINQCLQKYIRICANRNSQVPIICYVVILRQPSPPARCISRNCSCKKNPRIAQNLTHIGRPVVALSLSCVPWFSSTQRFKEAKWLCQSHIISKRLTESSIFKLGSPGVTNWWHVGHTSRGDEVSVFECQPSLGYSSGRCLCYYRTHPPFGFFCFFFFNTHHAFVYLPDSRS